MTSLLYKALMLQGEIDADHSKRLEHFVTSIVHVGPVSKLSVITTILD